MANRIRELRKQHKLTLKELGAKMGVAENTMSQYELGRRQPDQETIVKLAHYFGVTVDYLLGGDPPENPSVSQQEYQLIELFREMTPDERGMVETIVQSILDRHK